MPSIKLYNAEAKELIGTFRTVQLATKHLYKFYNVDNTRKLITALHRGVRIFAGSIYPFKVAARYGPDINEDFVIEEKYVNLKYGR